MNVSEKALSYADACVAGDIVSESQAPYLSRNFQMLIDEYEARIAKLERSLQLSDDVANARLDEMERQAARIAEMESTTKKVFDDMWVLLDAVAMEADDTLWYDGGTTAHERLCDVWAGSLSLQLANTVGRL